MDDDDYEDLLGEDEEGESAPRTELVSSEDTADYLDVPIPEEVRHLRSR